MKFLPYGQHSIDDDDIASVVDVLKTGPLTSGPKADEFEKLLATVIGAEEAVVCSNGTTALHLACLAAGVRSGDVAIVPAITFLSTANAVRMCGGDVVFADVCPATGLMTPETLSAAIKRAGGDVKAVLPVHLNGQSQYMGEIYQLAKEAGAEVITDCCHALGADYQAGGKPGDGQFEDFACYSFHPVKSIAMGEGGAVTTNDPEAARRMRHLRSHDLRRDGADWRRKEAAFDQGDSENPWYYEMQELGYNYRANDLQCALGISQLGKLGPFVERRRQIADLYAGALSASSNKIRPIDRSKDCESAWHLYPVLIDFAELGISRAKMMKALQSKGIGTQVHYIPVSDQPYYQELYGRQELPGAAEYYAKALSLPMYPALSDDDVRRVIAEILELTA